LVFQRLRRPGGRHNACSAVKRAKKRVKMKEKLRNYFRS
jgi:hypothetical protein